ncbi:MAG: AAA family ATPase, partial [Pseudomonadota bacterium]
PQARDMVALKTLPSKTKIAGEELSAEWAGRAARIGFDPKPYIDSALNTESDPASARKEDLAPPAKETFWEAIKRVFVPTSAVKSPEADPLAPKNGAAVKDVPAHAAVSYAVRSLAEREHGFTIGAIQRKALEANIPGVVIDGVDAEINRMRGDGRLIDGADRGAGLVTTPHALALERETIALVTEGIGKGRAFVGGDRLERELGSTSLTRGQKSAAMHILSSPDRVVGVQGFAGVGKTYMLERAFDILGRVQSENKNIFARAVEPFALAPSNSAVTTLKDKAGIDGWTLQRFLMKYDGVARGRLSNTGRQKLQKDWAHRIIVVDESSLASTQQARDLLKIAKDLNVPKWFSWGTRSSWAASKPANRSNSSRRTACRPSTCVRSSARNAMSFWRAFTWPPTERSMRVSSCSTTRSSRRRAGRRRPPHGSGGPSRPSGGTTPLSCAKAMRCATG